MLPKQGGADLILVRELRSHRPCSVAKNKNKKQSLWQGKVGFMVCQVCGICSQAALRQPSSLFSTYVPGTELGALRMRFHFFFSEWKTGGLGSATSLVIEVWARHVFFEPQFSHL